VPEMADAVRIEGHDAKFAQEGQSVFRWTTTQLPGIARQVCEKGGVTPEELGGVVLHQANLRIIEPLAKRLGAVNAVVARDVIESGNTSAASIPIALSKLGREARGPGRRPRPPLRLRRRPLLRRPDHPLPLSPSPPTKRLPPTKRFRPTEFLRPKK
jgi:3-oxoacyl-[acyl-carrier-protein] synthase-3